jgi:hypothetical protein
MSAVHRHTYSDVAERLNAVIAVQERGTKRITHADVEVFTALIILGAVSNRVGINNWKAPDTSLVFCGVDFTVYQSLATFKLIKKYYSWADAGTAEEIAADPWMRFRPGIDKFNATQRSFVEPTLECVVDESMSPYEPRSSATGTLPNLSFIVRKPEPLGSELKDTCDGGTGCMLHAEVQEGKDAMHSKAYFGLQVGTLGVVGATAACTLRMMEASCQHNGLLFGDSWFGSVLACVAGRLVLRNGLKVHSMFAIKTGHRFFPKEHIERLLEPLPSGARIVLRNRRGCRACCSRIQVQQEKSAFVRDYPRSRQDNGRGTVHPEVLQQDDAAGAPALRRQAPHHQPVLPPFSADRQPQPGPTGLAAAGEGVGRPVWVSAPVHHTARDGVD